MFQKDSKLFPAPPHEKLLLCQKKLPKKTCYSKSLFLWYILVEWFRLILVTKPNHSQTIFWIRHTPYHYLFSWFTMVFEEGVEWQREGGQNHMKSQRGGGRCGDIERVLQQNKKFYSYSVSYFLHQILLFFLTYTFSIFTFVYQQNLQKRDCRSASVLYSIVSLC